MKNKVQKIKTKNLGVASDPAKALAVSAPAIKQRFLSDAQIALIKSLLGKDLSDDEFKLFILTAEFYGLNPLLKEMFAYKIGGKLNMFAGRDGFLTIAHRNPVFAGFKSGPIKSGEKLVGAWCEVRRRDWPEAFKVEVSLNEYMTSYGIWPTKPQTMIIKVAESQALRKTFNINGLYDESELGSMLNGKASPAPSNAIETNFVEPLELTPKLEKISDSQYQKIHERLADIELAGQFSRAGVEKDLKACLVSLGIPNLKSLPADKYENIMKTLAAYGESKDMKKNEEKKEAAK